jgi:peptide-methionine (S)-S-oxide reductase
VSYGTLLDIFWRSVDPTDAGGQFCDRGHSYTTAIYAISPAQLDAALASKAALEKSGALDRPVATEIVEAGPFWPAEGYHQNYYETNALQYKFYRWRCGRDEALQQLWGKDAHMGIAKAE